MKKSDSLALFSAIVMMASAVLVTGCGEKQNETPAGAEAVTEAVTETKLETEKRKAMEADDSRKTTENTKERLDKIVIGIDSDPQDLLPYGNINSGGKPYIFHEIYETLFNMDNGEYVPILAKSYEKTDELHYRVEIYDYIYDSAGNHITADDVVFSYQTLLDSGFAARYDIFEEINKIDDYTVEFTWSRPVTAVGELEWPWCRTYVFSRKAYEEGSFATDPVGTGPYVAESFVSGSKVVLSARDDYWQKEELKTIRQQANVQTIQYDVITEAAQHVIALKTGTIDFSNKVTNQDLGEFEEGGALADQFHVYVTSGSKLYNLTSNCSSESITSDPNLRKAIYYAIDNQACATAVGNALPCKALGTPFFADYYESWEDKDNYMTVCNPELAREYLKKSKYQGESLRMMGGNDEAFKNLMTVIQAMLANVGIKMEINTVDSVVIPSYAADSTAWDLYLFTCGGGSQIGEWNRIMNHKEFSDGYSMGFVKDDKLQSLYETASSLETHDEEHMTVLHDYVIDNAYWYPVITPGINIVCREKLAEVYLRENEFVMPGACTYYLD